jgi:hypothetical protein
MSQSLLVLTALSYDSLAAGFLLRISGLGDKRARLLVLFTLFDGAATWTSCGRSLQPSNLQICLAAWLGLSFCVAAYVRKCGARSAWRGAIYLIPFVLCLDNVAVPPGLLASQSSVVRGVMAGAASGFLFLLGTWIGDVARQTARRLLPWNVSDVHF